MAEPIEKKKPAGTPPDPSAKKKKGKLPVFIALAVVLGSGGFFAMKVRGGAKPAPKTELGEMVQMEEFLTNLADKNAYVRTKVALHTSKGFKAETLAKNLAAVQDAINMELSRRSLGQVASFEGKAELKRSIAASVNKILSEAEAREHPDKKPEGEPAAEDAKPPEGWDSAKGPVLKVYFVSFATQ
jgi:flagellar basal body-associated protein FliL